MRTYSSDTEKLNAAIAGAVAAFTPPEDITVTQWADKKRRLSPDVSNMTTNINWLTPHGDAVKLMSPKKHQLDMRVAEEFWDVEQADVGVWADKYVMIVRPKTTDPGTVAPMGSADTSGEYVVYYFAAYKDGKQLWEVDKRNMKCVVDGVDYMAPVRKALGK